MAPIDPIFAQKCSPLPIEPAKLPPYTPLFVHAGSMSNTNQHGYCEEVAHWVVLEKMSHEHTSIYENPVGYLEKGTEIYIPGQPTVHNWSNPQKKENFQMDHVLKWQ